MPHLAAALLILVMLALPSGAFAQAGVSYQVPPDNPFVGQAGAAPEVYALGLRNPYRFSFDRQNGDLLIGDVGGAQREEIDWVTAAGARGANFGWACLEGTQPGPSNCEVPDRVEPLFEYPTSSPDAVTGGFVVRDPALTGLFGRYLYADHYTGEIFSLKLAFGDTDNTPTGETIPTLASFGEDASGRLYAVNRIDGTLSRLVPGPTSGTLGKEALAGPFALPIAIGTYPGDANRLFVGEQAGKVRLVVDGAVRPTPFLDVAPFGLTWGVSSERGLLSVVAAPDYPSSGKIYVYYTDSGGDIRIEEFTRSEVNPEVADPSSRRTVLVIEHSSAENHNGGQMHFGADGCMWVTTGDGGGATGHANNPQNPGTLLGKVLRIDPEPPGPGRAECVAAQALPGPGGGAGADTTAPSVFARAPRRQRVLRQRGAFVFVSCSENCSLSAGGTLVIGRGRLLLRRVPIALAGGSRTRLLVRAHPRARRLLRAALRRGRRPRVELRLHATDAAGNRSPVMRRSVRVRR